MMVVPTLINRIFKRKITIHTIGDSHAKIPWENIRIKDFQINTNRLGPRLMFTIGENPEIISTSNPIALKLSNSSPEKSYKVS